MRVYIPLDRRGLELLGQSGEAAPGRAYAVTPAFAEAYGSDDVEELEYAALMVAASAATDADGHQVVLAADVVSVGPDDDEHPATVDLEEPVPLGQVASIHVGEEGDDLAWYAPQELSDLVG